MKETIGKIKKLILIGTTLWSFATAFMFGANAVDLFLEPNYFAFGFVSLVTLSYVIITIILFFLQLKKKNTIEAKDRLSIFKIIRGILKLVIAVTSIILVSGLFSIELSNIIKRFNIVWIIFTILFELLAFTLKRLIRRMANQD